MFKPDYRLRWEFGLMSNPIFVHKHTQTDEIKSCCCSVLSNTIKLTFLHKKCKYTNGVPCTGVKGAYLGLELKIASRLRLFPKEAYFIDQLNNSLNEFSKKQHFHLTKPSDKSYKFYSIIEKISLPTLECYRVFVCPC